MDLERENAHLRQECIQLRTAFETCSARLQDYERLFEFSPSACLTLDPHGVIIEVNGACAAMLASTRMTLSGQAFARFVFPEDLPRYLVHLRPDASDESPIHSDFRVIREDGAELPVMMRSVRIEPGEERACLFLADLKDITVRRRAEEALRHERDFNAAVLETSGALIIVLDETGRIVRFNQACEETSGYCAEDVIGKFFWDVVLPQEQVQRTRRVFEDLANLQMPSSFENHWITKNGERRLISWANSVLRSADGTVRAVIGSGLDISERRRLESEVLEICEREQRRIGADLHDGLGQQLTGMSLMCENLRDDLAKFPKLRDQAAALGAQLREAIGRTRTLSHGFVLLNLEDNGLREALQALADDTTSASAVVCDFLCEPDVTVPDLQIASHLYRITQEAVNNAIKHGAPTRITIQLECVHGAAHLVVKDNGTGFPATAGPPGIGLAVMKYRANLMGGALNVTSTPDRGVAIDCVVFLNQ